MVDNNKISVPCVASNNPLQVVYHSSMLNNYEELNNGVNPTCINMMSNYLNGNEDDKTEEESDKDLNIVDSESEGKDDAGTLGVSLIGKEHDETEKEAEGSISNSSIPINLLIEMNALEDEKAAVEQHTMGNHPNGSVEYESEDDESEDDDGILSDDDKDYIPSEDGEDYTSSEDDEDEQEDNDEEADKLVMSTKKRKLTTNTSTIPQKSKSKYRIYLLIIEKNSGNDKQIQKKNKKRKRKFDEIQHVKTQPIFWISDKDGTRFVARYAIKDMYKKKITKSYPCYVAPITYFSDLIRNSKSYISSGVDFIDEDLAGVGTLNLLNEHKLDMKLFGFVYHKHDKQSSSNTRD